MRLAKPASRRLKFWRERPIALLTGPTAHERKPCPLTLSKWTTRSRRSRLKTFFRGLLAMPHFLFAGAYTLAFFVVYVIAWFTLLFTGRWPAGMYQFARGYLRYSARLAAYRPFRSGRQRPITTTIRIASSRAIRARDRYAATEQRTVKNEACQQVHRRDAGSDGARRLRRIERHQLQRQRTEQRAVRLTGQQDLLRRQRQGRRAPSDPDSGRSAENWPQGAVDELCGAGRAQGADAPRQQAGCRHPVHLGHRSGVRNQHPGAGRGQGRRLRADQGAIRQGQRPELHRRRQGQGPGIRAMRAQRSARRLSD